jgi:hypothetical protein
MQQKMQKKGQRPRQRKEWELHEHFDCVFLQMVWKLFLLHPEGVRRVWDINDEQNYFAVPFLCVPFSLSS